MKGEVGWYERNSIDFSSKIEVLLIIVIIVLIIIYILINMKIFNIS